MAAARTQYSSHGEKAQHAFGNSSSTCCGETDAALA